MLWTAPVVGLDPFVISALDQDPELPDPASPDEEPYGPSEGEDLHPPDDLDDLMESPPQPPPPQVQHGSDWEPPVLRPDDPVPPGSSRGNGHDDPAVPDSDVSPKERQAWEAKISRFHRAAGHPTARNLARMLQDAQVEPWKVKAALQYRCPACEEQKPGGSSSKQVPNVSIRPLPQAWEQVGINIAEWEVPGQDLKVKFILLMDMATGYRVTESLATYKHGQVWNESAEDVMKAITLRWIMDKPRPKVIVPDNANTMLSQRVMDFLADLTIEVLPPPEGECWSHGLVERNIQHVKETASRIQRGSPDQDPTYSLALATSAVNSTEFKKGFSSIQWAFGRQAELSDDELRQQLCLPVDRQQEEPFLRLLQQRQVAEENARTARARLAISKLKNTSIRQPVRTFSMAQPVMMWRKFLPHTIYRGRKGGYRPTMRPRWIGPGRIVFHELVRGQDEEDREQIVWVLLGNKLYRASVHSVRPLSAREQGIFELTGDQSHRWHQLTDMIPKRNYTDVTGEVPQAGDVEGPHLPPLPDGSTILPRYRVRRKAPVGFDGRPQVQPGLPSGPSPSVLPPAPVSSVNEYEIKPGPAPDDLSAEGNLDGDEVTGNDIPKKSSRRSSIASRTPLLSDPSSIAEDQPEDALPPLQGSDDAVPEPDEKRPRTGSAHVSEDDLDFLDFNQCILDSNEGYIMELELDFSSNRQKKSFMNNPHAFLVKKLAGSEVSFRKLNGEERRLFENAKTSEVSSFIRTEAVRRCLSFEELQKAKNSDRVLRARWVLTWKQIPPEDRQEALDDRTSKGDLSVIDKSGTRKAKARIVVLGFEHPDLLQSTFRSSAPVQSQLMRNLSLALTAQRGWILEGLDMSTAFLQTGSVEMQQEELYTSGVPELKHALGANEDEVLRLLRNVYGNATAPRGLWKDLDRTFTKLGAHRIIGDSSFWVWLQKNPHPRNEADQMEIIGYVGGHVDDFNRSGDLENPEWLSIRAAIDKAYKWGTMKSQSFRHTGIDLQVCEHNDERWIQLSQDFYAESLTDLAIPVHRLRDDPASPLNRSEIAACRASLGAMQWLATQTQLQICARVNLLLTELTTSPTVTSAKEVQELIKEARGNPITLQLWRLPEVQHWQDMCVITLADQAWGNRPQGGSTGGYITFLDGPQHVQGKAGRLSIVSWKTWKLRRKAISTNDGEIQSMLEGEDANFRTRFLWCQLNGCVCKDDLLQHATAMVSFVKGINGTDSRGGFDAINKNEGPLLGLSNVRSALQAYQLREQLQASDGSLIWISGDWNLADAMTKKSKVARQGLMQYLINSVWKLTYDPGFIQSEKKAKASGTSAVSQMRLSRASPLGLIRPSGECPRKFWTDATAAFRLDIHACTSALAVLPLQALSPGSSHRVRKGVTAAP